MPGQAAQRRMKHSGDGDNSKVMHKSHTGAPWRIAT